MPRGGYQAPSSPAPVSGPGPLSKRTDGGPGQPKRDIPNAEYGEQKNFQEIQSGANMSAAPGLGDMLGKQGGRPVTPIGAPSMRPDEPVTAGSPSGPGMGPEGIGMGLTNKTQNEADARKIAQYLPSLERAANQQGVPTSFVRFVKYLREFQE